MLLWEVWVFVLFIIVLDDDLSVFLLMFMKYDVIIVDCIGLIGFINI